MEDVEDYIDPKKRSLLGFDKANSNAKMTGFNENQTSLSSTDLIGSQSSIFIESKTIIKDENKVSSVNNKRQRNKTLCMSRDIYHKGFDSLKENNLDQETKDLIYSLQARIVGLEKEVLNLKKTNYELSTQNKSFQEKMKLVAEEQEKVFKVNTWISHL